MSSVEDRLNSTTPVPGQIPVAGSRRTTGLLSQFSPGRPSSFHDVEIEPSVAINEPDQQAFPVVTRPLTGALTFS